MIMKMLVGHIQEHQIMIDMKIVAMSNMIIMIMQRMVMMLGGRMLPGRLLQYGISINVVFCDEK